MFVNHVLKAFLKISFKVGPCFWFPPPGMLTFRNFFLMVIRYRPFQDMIDKWLVLSVEMLALCLLD